MSKAKKRWLIIAAILVWGGLVIFVGAMSAYHGDFSKSGTVKYETNTYEINEDFDSISIDTDITEITFAPAEGEICRIVCYEMEKVRHSAAVKNGQLSIRTVDTRKWYEHISISFEQPKMTVYLPNENYADVFIETDTGNVYIPKEFSFHTLEIEGDTADIDCLASVAKEVKVESDTGYIKMAGITAGRAKLSTKTGSITLHAVTVKNNVDIETDTGKMELTDVHCSDLQAESDTGNVHLENVIATGGFSIKTDTGDIRFDNADAQEIFVETDTGDVRGTLLTDKIFMAESDTGHVDVPKTVKGGRCEITTDTGDIKIKIHENP